MFLQNWKYIFIFLSIKFSFLAAVNFEKFSHCLEKLSSESHGTLVPPPYMFGNPTRNINKQWNTRLPELLPLGYFIPKNAKGVSHAVKCGVKSGVKLIPNSGGHSYEAISWGSNSTVIIDFREMKSVDVSGEGKDAIAVIQPGALVGNINAQLWMKGKLGIAMGNCQTVGMGGHAIGGGVGYMSSMYSLTLDNVIEFEMVDAKGDILIANSESNPGLFWALRGSGPGYLGIVTRVNIKTFQADKIKITYVRKVYPVKDFAKVYKSLHEWMEWVQINEPSVFTFSFIFHDDWTSRFPPGLVGGITIGIVFIQDPNKNPGRNDSLFLQKFQEIFPPGDKGQVTLHPTHLQLVVGGGYAPIQVPTVASRDNEEPVYVSVGDLSDSLLDEIMGTASGRATVEEEAETERLTIENILSAPFLRLPEEDLLKRLLMLEKDMAMPRFFKAKSLFVNRKQTDAELEQLGEILTRIPNNRCWILLTAETGAIHEVPWHATAYSHRHSIFDITVHVEAAPGTGDTDEAMAWMEEFYSALLSADSGETYQNYPDLELKNHLHRFYGRNLPRLNLAKTIIDPEKYFQNSISLPGLF